MSKKRGNGEIFQDIINKTHTTKKLVRDKSNGYDLVNKMTLAYIENENIDGLEKQVTLKNFNAKYINKDGKSIEELVEAWKLYEFFKFSNTLEPTETSLNTENKINKLVKIIENFVIDELNTGIQSINIAGQTDTTLDFN